MSMIHRTLFATIHTFNECLPVHRNCNRKIVWGNKWKKGNVFFMFIFLLFAILRLYLWWILYLFSVYFSSGSFVYVATNIQQWWIHFVSCIVYSVYVIKPYSMCLCMEALKQQQINRTPSKKRLKQIRDVKSFANDRNKITFAACNGYHCILFYYLYCFLLFFCSVAVAGCFYSFVVLSFRFVQTFFNKTQHFSFWFAVYFFVVVALLLRLFGEVCVVCTHFLVLFVLRKLLCVCFLPSSSLSAVATRTAKCFVCVPLLCFYDCGIDAMRNKKKWIRGIIQKINEIAEGKNDFACVLCKQVWVEVFFFTPSVKAENTRIV